MHQIDVQSPKIEVAVAVRLHDVIEKHEPFRTIDLGDELG